MTWRALFLLVPFAATGCDQMAEDFGKMADLRKELIADVGEEPHLHHEGKLDGAPGKLTVKYFGDLKDDATAGAKTTELVHRYFGEETEVEVWSCSKVMGVESCSGL